MISFTSWINEVERIGKLLKHKDDIDHEHWRDYFNSDLTPAEAWEEETAMAN